MPTIAEALQAGLDLQLAQRWNEAEQIYRQILQVAPREPQAWHRLGMIALGVNRADLALSYLQQAIAINPSDAAFHNNLGTAHARLGRFPEAVAAMRRAVELVPDWSEAWTNLGVTQARWGRYPEAIAALRQALSLEPQNFDVLHSLAIALASSGATDEAVVRFRETLALRPEFAEAYSNLSNVLLTQGKLDDAIANYRRAIELKPDFQGAQTNLGVALALAGRVDESVETLSQVVARWPDHVDGWSNFGNALLYQGRVHEAAVAFGRALALRPTHVHAASNQLLALNYDTEADPAEVLEKHRAWGARAAAELYRPVAHANSKDPERRLRIGFVSADLRRHPVSRFIAPLLANLDRQQFETVAYADEVVPDEVTARLRTLTDRWHNTTGVPDERIADMVRADGIDILFDLAGHTANNRLALFARKPAPIQIAYLGYAQTTGLPSIDYHLTDAVVDPPGAERWFTERLLRVEGGFCAFEPPSDAPQVGPLPAASRGTITFGSLHNLPRLNRSVMQLWAECVHAVPGSRLLLYRDAFKGRTLDYYCDELLASGFAADEFEIRNTLAPGQNHLHVYHDIDITLDTFPWSGHTTACESLWMGVPVITLAGNRHAGRMVTSVLTQLGCEAWIARTPADYVEIVRKLAGDLEGLARWRSELRGQMAASRLCDAAGFARSVGESLRQVWRVYCNGS